MAARVSNAALAEIVRKLEQQVIELAAQVERQRLDLINLTARVTIAPPKPSKPDP